MAEIPCIVAACSTPLNATCLFDPPTHSPVRATPFAPGRPCCKSLFRIIRKGETPLGGEDRDEDGVAQSVGGRFLAIASAKTSFPDTFRAIRESVSLDRSGEGVRPRLA